jgi:hypothetical protein
MPNLIITNALMKNLGIKNIRYWGGVSGGNTSGILVSQRYWLVSQRYWNE